jgi:hypothetical protein
LRMEMRLLSGLGRRLFAQVHAVVR